MFEVMSKLGLLEGFIHMVRILFHHHRSVDQH